MKVNHRKNMKKFKKFMNNSMIKELRKIIAKNFIRRLMMNRLNKEQEILQVNYKTLMIYLPINF